MVEVAYFASLANHNESKHSEGAENYSIIISILKIPLLLWFFSRVNAFSLTIIFLYFCVVDLVF